MKASASKLPSSKFPQSEAVRQKRQISMLASDAGVDTDSAKKKSAEKKVKFRPNLISGEGFSSSDNSDFDDLGSSPAGGADGTGRSRSADEQNEAEPTSPWEDFGGLYNARVARQRSVFHYKHGASQYGHDKGALHMLRSGSHLADNASAQEEARSEHPFESVHAKMPSAVKRGMLSTTRKGDKAVKTELQTGRNNTKHQILHGFWLATDVVIFVTNEKKANNYWLEMFRFGEKEDEKDEFYKSEPVDQLLLFNSKKDVRIEVQLGDFRRFAAILVEVSDHSNSRRSNNSERCGFVAGERRVWARSRGGRDQGPSAWRYGRAAERPAGPRHELAAEAEPSLPRRQQIRG